MKIQKLVLAFVLAGFVLVSCKNETKKTEANSTKKEIATGNTQKLNLNISGMTCEIGCAKTIESKLSKKEGVDNAKVIFKDSLAVIEYDATKTNKKDLIAFVEGIAGGKTYKATETDRVAKTCGADCKKACCNKDKKDCKKGAKCNHKTKEECKKAGCDKKASCDKKGADCKKGAKCNHKTKEECKKVGCDKKMAANCSKKNCKKDAASCKGKDAKDCKKGASCDKKNKTACKPGCTKPCCAKKAS